MSTVASPLPHFPLEVKGHILGFCDAPTLASSSQVSLAFLEMSGPLLYWNITIRSKEQLEKLVRSDTVLSSIAPFLSLAQTRTFTYRLEQKESDADSYDISRALSSLPTEVDTLVIDAQAGWGSVDYINLDVLFASLDPAHLHVIGPKTYRDPCSRLVEFSDDLLWPRLRRITWENALSYAFLACTPFAGQGPLVDLVLDITGPDPYSKDITSALETLSENLDDVDETEDKAAFGRIQVWLNDAEEVTRAKQILTGETYECLEIKVKSSTTS